MTLEREAKPWSWHVVQFAPGEKKRSSHRRSWVQLSQDADADFSEDVDAVDNRMWGNSKIRTENGGCSNCYDGAYPTGRHRQSYGRLSLSTDGSKMRHGQFQGDFVKGSILSFNIGRQNIVNFVTDCVEFSVGSRKNRYNNSCQVSFSLSKYTEKQRRLGLPQTYTWVGFTHGLGWVGSGWVVFF